MLNYDRFLTCNSSNKYKNTPIRVITSISQKMGTVILTNKADNTQETIEIPIVIEKVLSEKLYIPNAYSLKPYFSKFNDVLQLKLRAYTRLVEYLHKDNPSMIDYCVRVMKNISSKYDVDLRIYSSFAYIGLQKVGIFCKVNKLPYVSRTLSRDERDLVIAAIFDTLLNDMTLRLGYPAAIRIMREQCNLTKSENRVLGFKTADINKVYGE